MNKPLLIGITGGIGSGKTTVSRVFKTLGVPVYYADDHAKRLMVQNQTLTGDIKALFGEESYDSEGRLNRAYLTQRVFSDARELEKLNALVHPAVGRDFANWVANHDDHPYLLKEAALIFETGSNKLLDKVVVVTAPVEERVKRVLLRDIHRSREQVLAIMEQQLSERKSKADFIIDNSGKVMVIPQVIALDQNLRRGGGEFFPSIRGGAVWGLPGS